MDNLEQILRESQQDRRNRIQIYSAKRKIEEINNKENAYCEHFTCLNPVKYKIETSRGKTVYSCEKHKDMIGEAFVWANQDTDLLKNKETGQYKYAYEIIDDSELLSNYKKVPLIERMIFMNKCMDTKIKADLDMKYYFYHIHNINGKEHIYSALL